MRRTVTPEAIPDIAPMTPGSVRTVQVDGFGRLGVAEYGDAASDKTWVQLQAWSGYVGRPDEMAREQVMANYLGGRLITLDTPGLGPNSGNLSAGLRRDVRHGNLRGVAEIQREALVQATEQPFGNVSLLGYSMGTPLVAEFLRQAPATVGVGRTVLVEPVADNPMNIAMLGARLSHNAFVRADYRRGNPDWYRALPRTLPRQTGSLLAYACMIARGGQFDDIGQFSGIPVTVLSGSESDVSPLPSVTRLAQRLNAEQVILNGHNHSFIDSLGNMAWLASYLKDIDN